MVGEHILGLFLALPRVVGENILGVFLAVPMVVGENILEVFLILGATGHGCSAEGTDAAPRAHGTGALQASQTYVRTALIDFPFDRRGLFLARVDQMIRQP